MAELSARAYAAGMAAGDPILVLSAAKLRKSLAPVAGDRAAVDGVAGAGAPLGWEEMLASAAELAGEDEVLLGLIEDASVEMSKGVASGPVYNIGSLGNGKGDTYPPHRPAPTARPPSPATDLPPRRAGPATSHKLQSKGAYENSSGFCRPEHAAPPRACKCRNSR